MRSQFSCGLPETGADEPDPEPDPEPETGADADEDGSSGALGVSMPFSSSERSEGLGATEATKGAADDDGRGCWAGANTEVRGRETADWKTTKNKSTTDT